MRRLLLAALAVSVFVACQPATTELTDEMKAEITTEVQAAINDYTEAWESVDLERGMAFTLNSPDAMWVGLGRITRDVFTQQEAIIAQSSWMSLVSAKYASTDEQLTVLAPDVVLHILVGTATFTNADGAANEMDYTYAYIWVHRDGEWKVLLMSGP